MKSQSVFPIFSVVLAIELFYVSDIVFVMCVGGTPFLSALSYEILLQFME